MTSIEINDIGPVTEFAYEIGDPAQKRQLAIAVLRKALEIAEATE